MGKFFKFVTSILLVSVFSLSSPAKAEQSYCSVPGFFQSSSDLTVYESLKKVTNHRVSSYDITGWNCRTNRFVGLQVEDNFGLTSQTSIYFNFYFPMNAANCWRVKHVYENGEGEWSNKVCYAIPVVQPVFISGIYMYLNSGGVMDGNVYIKWQKSYDSGSLYWTTCPPASNWNPSDPNWSYEQPSYGASGQTIFGGHTSEGFRCYVVAAKSSEGVLSAPMRVEYTYSSSMAQPYSSSPNYVAPIPTSNYSTSSGGATSTWSSSSNSCVGICYGVPSKVNGLLRNSYVPGYYTSTGKYVSPYTRSKP